jgi:hypothetical protein
MDNTSHALEVNDVFQSHPRYYVNRLSNPITINQDVATNFVTLVVNLNEVALEVKVETMGCTSNPRGTIQKKLLSLPPLPAQKTHSKKNH